jgi:hypothetical protein
MLKGKYPRLCPGGFYEEYKYIDEMFEGIKKYWKDNEKKVYHLRDLISNFSTVNLHPILEVVFQVVLFKKWEDKIKEEVTGYKKPKNELLIEASLELERDFTAYLTLLVTNELKHLESEKCSN